MGAKAAAREFVRTGVLPQWMHNVDRQFAQRFWQWVRIMESA